jgi:hypothetical protein
MKIAMTLTLTTALVLAAAGALAQQNGSSQRRVPLADVDDLEPAVDVGAARAPIVDEAPPRAATPPAAPAVPPVPAAPAAQPLRSESEPRPAPRVMDSLDLGTTSITGNAELPKVLYIVPWKKSDLGDLVGRPVNTLLDEVLAPVDPAVFERHLSYYESLHGAGQEE